MDMSKYEQMPDLPNADIMFTSELEDMAGSQLADYMSDEEAAIERDRIENDMDLWDSERIAQYEADMSYKSRYGVWA